MSKTILVVDDSGPSRQIVRRVMENAGFALCGEAVDGVDAVDKASELKPDLIVLDLRLPRLNGIEVACILKGRLPNTPIVLFTMYEVSSAVVASAGIRSVVLKSDGIAKLAACVQVLLAPKRKITSPSGESPGAVSTTSRSPAS